MVNMTEIKDDVEFIEVKDGLAHFEVGGDSLAALEELSKITGKTIDQVFEEAVSTKMHLLKI